MRAQAILFDKDGTLFDFQKTWAAFTGGMIRSRAQSDPALMREMADVMGFDLAGEKFLPESRFISSTVEEVAGLLLPFYPGATVSSVAADLNAATANVDQIAVLPLPEFFDHLIGLGLNTGIATNDGEVPARAHLEQFLIAEKFSFIAGYDSGYGAKPGPGMCTAFARHTGLAADRIAMVGDSLHDLQAGRAAGMQCIGVLTGVATADDLAPFADVVLPDIGHLTDWLAS